ncbi:MAG: META domain-containing protein [Pseudomonadota bacterium]
MLYRLCSIFLLLTLISACGKNTQQAPIIEHQHSTFNGFWLPEHDESAKENKALAFMSNAQLAFVYPLQYDHAQSQDVHTMLPLSWNDNGQELTITSMDTQKNASSSSDLTIINSVFAYTMEPSQEGATSLTLKPTTQDTGTVHHTYTKDDAAMGILHGSLFYRERMMLPPDAVAVIMLQETSRADAPAIILSSIAIGGANHTPLAFQIPYNKEDILHGHRYSLRAYIMSQGTMLFSTTNAYPVLRRAQTENPASVDMLLHRVMSYEESQENSGHTPLQNTYWALESLHSQAAEHFVGQEIPHLVLAADGKSSGSDGCNRFFGTYTTHEHRITLQPGGSTMMLCPHGDKQAANFMSTLYESTAYDITDQTLTLLRGKDVVARFVAKPKP